MISARRPALLLAFLLALAGCRAPQDRPRDPALDPRGRLHIPIGLPDTLDTLKTFVEAEGGFSPGVGSYGISFWVFDREARKLTAPTMPHTAVDHGLAPGGLLVPWSCWSTGTIEVKTEVCEVRRAPDQFITAARVTLVNRSARPVRLSLYAARTTWRPTVAMPHAWSLAEFWLLLRDSLVHEDGDRLVLFAGLPPKWRNQPLKIENLPTAFGPLTLAWDGKNLHIAGDAHPPGGFVVRTLGPQQDKVTRQN